MYVRLCMRRACGGRRYDSRTNCYSGGVHKCFGDDCYTSTFYFAFGVCIVSTIVASLVRSQQHVVTHAPRTYTHSASANRSLTRFAACGVLRPIDGRSRGGWQALMDWSVYFDVSPGGVSRVRKREEARLKAVGDGARERCGTALRHCLVAMAMAVAWSRGRVVACAGVWCKCFQACPLCPFVVGCA